MKVGEEASFFVTLPGTNLAGMEAQAISPSGVMQPCVLEECGAGRYRGTFKPKESGQYELKFEYKGLCSSGMNRQDLTQKVFNYM